MRRTDLVLWDLSQGWHGGGNVNDNRNVRMC